MNLDLIIQWHDTMVLSDLDCRESVVKAAFITLIGPYPKQ
jgi:hypothetical protein